MAYSLKYSYNSTSQSYSVTGYENITTSDIVVIPSVYNDGTNGEHPVTSISSDAFMDCSSLTSIVIPNSVTSIGSYTFAGCSNLTSIELPDNITSIGGGAFTYCYSLTSIIIPDRVTSIDQSTFQHCASLTSVTIPNSVTSIGNSAFYHCSSLTSVEIPNKVITINDFAFYNCSGLKSITIPDSITSIGSDAFSGCTSLTSVTIGNGVTKISTFAFFGCSSLKQLVLFPSIPPTLGSDAIPTNVQSIYVQQSSKAAYQAATNWNAFADKIVSDNMYLSFVRFNRKNKEYIGEKAELLRGYVDDQLHYTYDDATKTATFDGDLQARTATFQNLKTTRNFEANNMQIRGATLLDFINANNNNITNINIAQLKYMQMMDGGFIRHFYLDHDANYYLPTAFNGFMLIYCQDDKGNLQDFTIQGSKSLTTQHVLLFKADGASIGFVQRSALQGYLSTITKIQYAKPTTGNRLLLFIATLDHRNDGIN